MRKKVLVVEDDGELRPGLVDEAEIEPYGDSVSRPLADGDAENLSVETRQHKQKRTDQLDKTRATLVFIVGAVLVLLVLIGLSALMLLSRMPKLPTY
jgi:hypothetical protein